MAAWHRDVVVAHMKELGLRLKAKKSVLSPLQRTTYLDVVWDSTTMQAQLSPARIEVILTAVRGVREGQSLTVRKFQRLLGLLAAGSNMIPFGLLYMRPLQWWLRTEGKSASHDQGHAAMLTCLRHVEETMVPFSRPVAGGSSCNANDGLLPNGLGSGHEWPLCPRSVGRPSSHVAHQLPGDVGCVSSFKTLPSKPKGTSCACPYRQHIGGLLHQPAGGSALAPPLQAGREFSQAEVDLFALQLFVCFGPPKKGVPATKQTLSQWVVETITLAYESSCLQSPMGVRAQSTRGMAASKALSVDVVLQDVCAAAGWSSPHTFIRFYSLDLTSTPGSQVLSS